MDSEKARHSVTSLEASGHRVGAVSNPSLVNNGLAMSLRFFLGSTRRHSSLPAAIEAQAHCPRPERLVPRSRGC